jgi:hypothetical protein
MAGALSVFVNLPRYGLLGLMLATACGGAPSYLVVSPSASWQRLPDAGDRVAFHHTDGGTLAVNATCDKADDVPLHVLTNHLLFGIDDRREQTRTPITVDGRAALRTRLEGRLDGVQVELELVVLKKDGCTYDLLLIARPGSFALREPEFARFVAGFSQRPGRGSAR